MVSINAQIVILNGRYLIVTDYYKTLGVARDASADDIKKAFRKLSMEYHPDRHPDNPVAEAKFKEMSEAYSVLSNPDKKAQHDNPNPFAGMGHPFSDMGGFNVRRQRPDPNRPMKGINLKFVVDAPISKFIFGGEETFSPSYNDACPTCNGKGYKSSKPCPNCDGSGQIIQERNINGMHMMTQATCGACRGRGEIGTDNCEECNSSGRVNISRDITISIKPGSRDGSIVGFGGQGGIGLNGGPRGDLHIKLRMVMPSADKFNKEEKGIIIDLFA